MGSDSDDHVTMVICAYVWSDDEKAAQIVDFESSVERHPLNGGPQRHPHRLPLHDRSHQGHETELASYW